MLYRIFDSSGIFIAEATSDYPMMTGELLTVGDGIKATIVAVGCPNVDWSRNPPVLFNEVTVKRSQK